MSAFGRYLQLRSPRLGPFGTRVLFWLLVALWLLNIADLALTSYGIWLGFASESNGVMRYFLHQGTVTAAVFKIGFITIGALLLWRLRHYRSALMAAALLAGIFAAVVTYQALWLASL
jgi:hypothetical protein